MTEDGEEDIIKKSEDAIKKSNEKVNKEIVENFKHEVVRPIETIWKLKGNKKFLK